MIDTAQRSADLAEWLEAVARSEADLAVGRIVSGEAVRRELQESIARFDRKPYEPLNNYRVIRMAEV